MIDQEKFTWFAAIDWGTESHQACVLDAGGGIAGERAFSHDGAGLALLCDWILSIAGSATGVAVAVEVPHGPVVDSLMDRGMAVHAINPKQLDRLRDRFSVSGAKDDRRDAYVAADGLRTDRHLFRRLHVADPRLIELREWSRLAEELQQERVRLSNRLHNQLWRYYPQMLKLTDDVAADWLLDIWTLAPTPTKSKHLRKTSVERLLKRNRIRRIDAETVLHTLRQAAIKVADGVTEAATIHIRSLIARLRVVNRELRDATHKLDELCAGLEETPAAAAEHGGEQHDVKILKVHARNRQDQSRNIARRGFRASQSPRLPGAQDFVRRRARDEAKRKVPRGCQALRRSRPSV